MKILLSAAIAAVLFSACSPSTASQLDGNDDLHCAVMAFHLAGAQRSAPAAQARAAFVLSAWYNRQVGRKPDLQRAAPILEAVKKDPAAAGPAIETCTERAVSDPGFERFAREASAAWDSVAAETPQARK